MTSLAAQFGMLTILAIACASDAHSQAVPITESIQIVRSVRLSRESASEYCDVARAGFVGAAFEDRYDFMAVQTRPVDGAVVDASSNPAGGLRACFGPASDPMHTNFFGEGNLSGVSFTGRGDCRLIRQEFPESGIMLFKCHLELSNLPAPYVAGLLTTSTVVSRRTIGVQSDPPGYTQASIATVRLWATTPR